MHSRTARANAFRARVPAFPDACVCVCVWIRHFLIIHFVCINPLMSAAAAAACPAPLRAHTARRYHTRAVLTFFRTNALGVLRRARDHSYDWCRFDTRRNISNTNILTRRRRRALTHATARRREELHKTGNRVALLLRWLAHNESSARVLCVCVRVYI